MRLAKWDNAKFILMYFVVLGHIVGEFGIETEFLGGLTYFIYLFHIPAFLFISGLFSKKSVRDLRYDKALAYFVLYVFIKSLRHLVLFLGLEEDTKFFLFREGNTPWFAIVLMLCYLVTMVVRKWNKIYVMVFFVGLGLMIGFDTKLGNIMAGTRFLTFYPFFLAGYYFDMEKLQRITQSIKAKVVSAAVLAGTLWMCFAGWFDRWPIEFLKGRDPYKEMHLLDVGLKYRSAYYVLVMLLVLCVLTLVPSVESAVSRWGSRTIQVFALHIPIVSVLAVEYEESRALQNTLAPYADFAVPIFALLLTIVLSLKIWEPLFKAIMNPMKGDNKTK